MTRLLLTAKWLQGGIDAAQGQIIVKLETKKRDMLRCGEQSIAYATDATLSARRTRIVCMRASDVFEASVNASRELRSRVRNFGR